MFFRTADSGLLSMFISSYVYPLKGVLFDLSSSYGLITRTCRQNIEVWRLVGYDDWILNIETDLFLFKRAICCQK